MNEGDLLLQEIFFILTPAVLIFAAIFGMTYIRLMKFRRVFRRYKRLQFQEVENERKRIANDLHDFVAGKLVKIKTELQLSLNANNNSSVAPVIERSLSELNLFHHELRNVVEYVYPKELLSNNLKNSLNNLASEMTTPETKVIMDVEFDQRIAQIQLHQLYRIIQEMLSNIIAHAKPQSVIVCVFDEQEVSKGYVSFSYAEAPQNKWGVHRKTDQRIGRGKYVIEERMNLISAKLRSESKNGYIQKILEFPLKATV